jgi:uncharacterized protein
MIATKHIVIHGANSRPTMATINYPNENANGLLIIYLHGFKSFINWGFHPHIANELAMQGHTVVRLNFSHNGVGHTLETCNDFIDLEAFGNNNFSKELQDIEALLAYMNGSHEKLFDNINRQNICIIGHSRGGGTAIIAAKKFDCVTKIITLNAVSNFDNLLYGINKEKWQETGVHYIANARTNQQMPLYYQLYKDYILHQSDFDILQKVAHMQKPFLCIHAAQDETVKVNHAYKLKAENKNIQLEIIAQTGHTFGAAHPMSASNIYLENVLQKIIYFLQD